MLWWTWISYQLWHHRLFIMLDPLRRHSGKKSLEVRKISHLVSLQLWLWKNFGYCNVRKHIEIKDSDNYINLVISLNFGSLDNMRITSSYPKDDLVISGKWLITSLGIKAKSRLKKYKKVRYNFQIIFGKWEIYW